MNKYFYSYEEFSKDYKKLADTIVDTYEVEAIVSIARGGMTLGHFLSEYLNIRDVFSINSISYDKMQKLDNIEVFNIPNLTKYKNILLVDDISDSGDTLKTISTILKDRFKNLEIKTATIFYKVNSKIEPDFYVRKNSDKWIDFFWEK